MTLYLAFGKLGLLLMLLDYDLMHRRPMWFAVRVTWCCKALWTWERVRSWD